MKREVKISAVQMASGQAIFDENQRGANVEKIIAYLEGEASDSDLVIFPELAITGYIPLRGYVPDLKSPFWELSEDVATSDALQRIQEATDKIGCVTVVGFSERSLVKYECFNSFGVFEKGQKVKVGRKTHLPTEENHYFVPGASIEVYDTSVGKLGVAVCYDLMYPEIFRIMALKGAEIIVIIANVLDMANFKEMSHSVPIARAIENQVHVIFCNGCARYKGRKRESRLLGETKIINSLGRIVSKAAGAEEGVIQGTVREEELKEGASYLAVFRDRQRELYRPLIEPLKGSSE